MSLRFFFFIFLLLQLPAYAAVIWYSVRTNPWVFYCAEALFVADVVFSALFYRKVLRPISTLSGGMSLLKSQDWNVQLRTVGQPETDSLVEVFNEMMSRLHKQRSALLEQRHFLSLLAEAAPVGIVVRGFNEPYLMVNPVAKEFMSSGEASRLDSIPDDGDEIIRTSDGSSYRCLHRHFMDCGVRCSFFIIENITDTITAAERNAYGKVIRIIAHEVNNTVAGLTTAIGSVESDDQELLDACSRRAMELSRFIGRFAEVVKIPEPHLENIDLNSLVESEAPFLESLCSRHGARLTIKTCNLPSIVRADAALLGQALVNIVKNACESTGAGGDITLSVGRSSLVVCDNGKGIDPEKSTRLFTPFFTDKPDGQGIGLTFVRDVLSRHGASFSLVTDPEDGLTRFTIRF